MRVFHFHGCAEVYLIIISDKMEKRVILVTGGTGLVGKGKLPPPLINSPPPFKTFFLELEIDGLEGLLERSGVFYIN